MKQETMEKGQKRMIHVKIWQNEDFAKMSPMARLVYIGLVILADDDGKLKGNSALIKSQIFPFTTDKEMPLESFKELLKEVKNTKLIDIYRVKNDFFIAHPNWHRYQYIRKDLYKPSNLPDNPLRDRYVTVTEKIPKIRQDKIRQDKGEEYLSNIPKEDMDQFLKRFDVSVSAIKSKAESFLLYCKSNGKTYKDYKSAILNAIKKDFPERKIEVTKVIKQGISNSNSEELKEKNKVLLAKFKPEFLKG